MSEMLVICGVALLVFGPKELPQIAKKIAKGMREIRRASDDLRRSIDIDDDDDHRFRPVPPPEAPASITGSPLTVDSGEAVPTIIPAAAVAVGSMEADEADEAEGKSPSSADLADDLPPAPTAETTNATEPGRG